MSVGWISYIAQHPVSQILSHKTFMTLIITFWISSTYTMALRWRHNGHSGISNHQPHHCLLKRLDRRRSKHPSSPLLPFVQGIHWWPVNSLHKWPVTWKMFPFNDVMIGWFTDWSSIITCWWLMISFLIGQPLVFNTVYSAMTQNRINFVSITWHIICSVSI